MQPTKSDCKCTLDDLKDLTVLPYGWCMIIRDPMFAGDVESFGIKYLGDIDPLQQIEELKKALELYVQYDKDGEPMNTAAIVLKESER